MSMKKIMRLLVFALVAVFVAAPFKMAFAVTQGTSKASTINWNERHHYVFYQNLLSDLSKQYPKIAKTYSIGHTWQERNLWCIELTSNAKKSTAKTGIAVFGNIHGGEQESGESAAYTAWYLANNYDKNKEVKSILDNYIVYVIPLINPDGYEQSFVINTRQNMRPRDLNGDGKVFSDPYTDTNGDGVIAQIYQGAQDSQIKDRVYIGMESPDWDKNGKFGDDPKNSGIDMNRTFDYMWNRLDVDTTPVLGGNSLASAGPAAASEPEVKAVQNFLISHPVKAMVTLHTGEQSVLYPWCWTPERAGDYSFMKQTAGKMVSAYEKTTGRPAYEMQSYDDYPTNAELIDWAYGRLGIHAYTMEVYTPGDPSTDPNAFIGDKCAWGNGSQIGEDQWTYIGDWNGLKNIWFRNTTTAKMSGKAPVDQDKMVAGVKDAILQMIHSEPHSSAISAPGYLNWNKN